MKKDSLSKHSANSLLRIAYITLYNLSGDESKEISYRDIAESFFVNEKTAHRVIALLENFVSDECNETIALEGYTYNEIQRSPHAEPFYVPQLRLTLSETQALLGALASTGLENCDSIFNKLPDCFACEADVNEILNQSYPANSESLGDITPLIISTFILNKLRLEFTYRKHDGSIKSYEVDPLYVMYKDDHWYMNAWDVKDDIQKFFVLSKMIKITSLNKNSEEHDYKHLNSFTFEGDEKSEITFKGGSYYDAISHSAFELIDDTGDDIVVLHNSSHPDWIARQVAASDGKITTSNKAINEEAKRYAISLINKARSI